MTWISTKDRLPEPGKYVLARHSRGTWHDKEDPENVNCVVVKLVKGISMQERELMKKGEFPVSIEIMFHGSFDKPFYSEAPRHTLYTSADEHGNNLVPYEWRAFGVDRFFGQDISHWMPIEPLSDI